MAKALFGHVGLSTDQRLAAEVRRLRSRVAELEEELARAKALLDREAAWVEDDLRLLTLPESEPALT